MNTDFPRTVLYAILNRVVQDFKPRNDKYKDTMEKVLNTLRVEEDKFAVQKELIKKFADESIKK